MPSQLALLLTTAFVLFLFWRERREVNATTGALWIPLLWVLIIGSRYASEWLGFGGAESEAEGSPLDALIFISLELAGLLVLFRRRFSVSTFIAANMAISLFLGYCAISILWSEFPFVAFKRWVKILGHPIMVLVIATEPDPQAAFVRLTKRAAYVIVPYSIMLIRYFPELGRGFSQWTGEGMNKGITTNKNLLGCDLLFLGLFFVWHLLVTRSRPKNHERKKELILIVTFLFMIGWLLTMANSATSLAALIGGISVLLILNTRFVDKRHLGAYLAVGLLIVTCVGLFFDISTTTVDTLGRDSTLTGRTELWDDVLALGINPVVGAGFESFWLGPRAEWLWAKYWWRPNQAHNGYLETYLNLGWIGVVLLATCIFAVFRKASRSLPSDFALGQFRIALLASIVLYNYTEATFKALHLLFFAFYLIAIDFPRPLPVSVTSTTGSGQALQIRGGRQRPPSYRQ
jgi:exopolysaccharide production protein ExoQ